MYLLATLDWRVIVAHTASFNRLVGFTVVVSALSLLLLLAFLRAPGPDRLSDVHVLLEAPGLVLGELEILGRDLFGCDTDGKAESTEHVGDDIHRLSELSSAEEARLDSDLLRAALDHPLLEEELTAEHDEEDAVVEKSAEHVELVEHNDAAVDRVEEVHQHEHVEDEGIHNEAVRALIVVIWITQRSLHQVRFVLSEA